MTLRPLDPFSIVIDDEKKIMREWYQWLVDLSVQSGLANPPVKVIDLPNATTIGVGARAYVKDATSATFGSPVIGGGSLTVPVYSDGTVPVAVWRVG